LSKARLLARVLLENRAEFGDRVTTILEANWERLRTKPARNRSVGFAEAAARLGTSLSTDASQILTESHLLRVEEEVLAGIEGLKRRGPFALSHNADFALARLCYLVCRALKPAIVLEAGVAYGVTSAFVLQALARNGRGKLLSVDLPPLGQEADRYVGALIPRDLRDRWQLHRGPSRRVLPELLPSVGSIDVFIHDSLHTYRNMRFEFEAVWPYLRPGGALIADDAGDNRSFVEFARKVNPRYWALVHEQNKDSVFGFLLKPL
jgi:predicted O-methyltransferase YrrM